MTAIALLLALQVATPPARQVPRPSRQVPAPTRQVPQPSAAAPQATAPHDSASHVPAAHDSVPHAAPVHIDSLTGPGVSQALARWRAVRVRDVRYDLALDVTARDSAVGRVTVHWTRVGDADAIL